jgi:hypothetical protein
MFKNSMMNSFDNSSFNITKGIKIQRVRRSKYFDVKCIKQYSVIEIRRYVFYNKNNNTILVCRYIGTSILY